MLYLGDTALSRRRQISSIRTTDTGRTSIMMLSEFRRYFRSWSRKDNGFEVLYYGVLAVCE